MTTVPEPYDAALRGDLRALPPFIAAAPTPGWGYAGGMLLWLAQPERDRPVSPPAPVSDADVEGLAEGHAHLARASLLALDARGVGEASAALARLQSPRARAWHHVVEGYRAVLAGDADAAFTHADAAQSLSNEQKWPTLLVESVLLRGVSHMTRGELNEATSVTRRATRMAQTEHVWLTHFFASAFLSRLRRLGARPHLAGLIASACLEAAPAIFSGWLRWELLFAGHATAAHERAGMDRAATLAGLYLRGEADTRLVDELRTILAPSALHRTDFEAALDATRLVPADGDSAVHAWLRGDVADAPPVLSGLTLPAWGDGSLDSAPAAVASPDGLRRRVLGFALQRDFPRVQPLGSRPARPESLAAALTLAAGGVERDVLFERVYGFAYRKEIHEASFKFVRHQARKLLEPFAEVLTEGGRVRLDVKTPFAIVDPRCRQPLQELMLRHMATAGAASAKDLAKRLDVPLRTVQLALREMTEDGVCVAEKAGRRVSYVVEDTTFCELTMV